jgi:ABC-type sulfate/molybdate transport systems ATPase subunit
VNEGKIQQVGTPDAVYDTPNSSFVFASIEESSVLPVKVEQDKVWLDERPLALAAGDFPDAVQILGVDPIRFEPLLLASQGRSRHFETRSAEPLPLHSAHPKRRSTLVWYETVPNQGRRLPAP